MTDAELFAAYLDTDYVVLEPGIALRIAERSAWLAGTFNLLSVNSAAFLTAFNPYSVAADEAENLSAQEKLRIELEGRGARLLMSGEGRGRSGDWPAEPSILALGLAYHDAVELGRAFCQNAFVFAAGDAVPALVWLGKAGQPSGVHTEP